MEETLFANLKSMVYLYRWRILGAAFLLAISNGLLIVNPLLFRQAVMALDPQTGLSIGPFSRGLNGILGRHASSVWTWAALLVAISLISALFKYWMRIGFFSVGRDAEQEMRLKLFERIHAQSMAFFDRHGTGELLSRMTNDISSYRDILGPGIMYPLYFMTLLPPALAALFFISVKLTVISLIPLFGIPLFNQTLRGGIFNLSLAVQKKLADLSNMAQEHFAGIRIVKSYVIEAFTGMRFSSLCKEMTRFNFKLVSLLGMIFPFFSLMTKVATVLLVLFSGIIILKAWGELTAADFVAFMWIQSYIFFPVLMLGWVLPIYSRGKAAYHRLVEVYKEPIEVHEGTKTALKVLPQADIQIQHLSYQYPSTDRTVLSDITLMVKGGTFVGITGPIGAGKTTLFRLLNREYEIPRGTIFIGDQDIRDYTFAALRQAFVTVEQAPFLFSKSIAENVRFGNEEASEIEMERVADFADLHETVLEFPDRYETMVGERGVTLSGGQKQRIALARALLVDRSILLLDDIFSAVDSETEKKIFNALKAHFQGKTVLLISHRVSILEQMDRILYMHAGKITEDGPPRDLIKKKGCYYALTQLQSIK